MTQIRNISIDGVPRGPTMDVSKFFTSTQISIVVADARADDMPIVYVNRAFELTTGYSHRFAVGRNCRFLQGEDTDLGTVKDMATALSRGVGIQCRLLNYRAD